MIFTVVTLIKKYTLFVNCSSIQYVKVLKHSEYTVTLKTHWGLKLGEKSGENNLNKTRGKNVEHTVKGFTNLKRHYTIYQGRKCLLCDNIIH